MDATAGDDARRVKQELAKVKRQIANLVNQLADGVMADLVKPRLFEFDQERKRLQERQAELAKRTSGLANDLNAFRQQLGTVRAAFNVATWQERCELMRLLIRPS
jgi:DNA anti-recombination protein RmuC